MLIKPPGELSDDELAEVLRESASIREWLDGCRKEAAVRIQDGARMPGVYLSKGRQVQKWAVDDEGVIEQIKYHCEQTGESFLKLVRPLPPKTVCEILDDHEFEERMTFKNESDPYVTVRDTAPSFDKNLPEVTKNG